MVGECRLLLLCAVTALVSPAQTFTALFSFDEDNGGSYARGSSAGLRRQLLWDNR